MSEVSLNLVVIRSIDIDGSAKFYRQIGLSFVKHQHGNGLEHFASEIGNATFEIYPCLEDASPTKATRIGFQVTDVDVVVSKLQQQGYSIVSLPANSPWGRRAVAIDPDGHRVELTEPL